MHALVMAGGKGSRLGFVEKPLLSIRGKPMIGYILDALIDSGCFSGIWVAVSKNTVNTKAYLLANYNVRVIDTDAIDYVYDLNHAIKYIRGMSKDEEPILVASADLVLLDSIMVRNIVNKYNSLSNKDAWVVVTCTNPYMQSKPRVDLNQYYTGISIVNPRLVSSINTIREEYVFIDDVRVAVDVDTMDDLKIVEHLLDLL